MRLTLEISKRCTWWGATLWIGECHTTTPCCWSPVAIALNQQESRGSFSRWPLPLKSVPLIFLNAKLAQKVKWLSANQQHVNRRRRNWFSPQINSDPLHKVQWAEQRIPPPLQRWSNRDVPRPIECLPIRSPPYKAANSRHRLDYALERQQPLRKLQLLPKFSCETTEENMLATKDAITWENIEVSLTPILAAAIIF